MSNDIKYLQIMCQIKRLFDRKKCQIKWTAYSQSHCCMFPENMNLEEKKNSKEKREREV